eukprot:jgi/Psemu1/304967/fgenesh1_kg.177_\
MRFTVRSDKSECRTSTNRNVSLNIYLLPTNTVALRNGKTQCTATTAKQPSKEHRERHGIQLPCIELHCTSLRSDNHCTRYKE